MTTTEKDGVEICSNYLTGIEKATGIRPRVSMMSALNYEEGTIDTFATADKRKDLAEKVMFAEGERIETVRLSKLKKRPPEPWRRLMDYFTEERLANNPLVRAEKAVLEANGYNIETDYYLAIDIPVGEGPLEKAFFLFATKNEKAVFHEILPKIREIII